MRKFLAGIIALCAAVVGLTVVTTAEAPPAQAATVNCIARPTVKLPYSMGFGGSKGTVYIKWKYCWNSGHPNAGWAKLVKITAYVNGPFPASTCIGGIDTWMGNTFYVYGQQSGSRTSWRSSALKVDCTFDTTNHGSMSLDKSDRLYYTTGRAPLVKVLVIDNNVGPNERRWLSARLPHP